MIRSHCRTELVTLRDAANYITKMPKREHDAAMGARRYKR
jgi:hypothetical protein